MLRCEAHVNAPNGPRSAHQFLFGNSLRHRHRLPWLPPDPIPPPGKPRLANRFAEHCLQRPATRESHPPRTRPLAEPFAPAATRKQRLIGEEFIEQFELQGLLLSCLSTSARQVRLPALLVNTCAIAAQASTAVSIGASSCPGPTVSRLVHSSTTTTFPLYRHTRILFASKGSVFPRSKPWGGWLRGRTALAEAACPN